MFLNARSIIASAVGGKVRSMRAIMVREHGGPEVLEIRELPAPVAGEGDVLVRVRAFGLNHADTYMRSGVRRFGIPVLGIEAGTVEHDPSGRLESGTAVVAIVGGMACDRNGSYAELVSVRAGNLVPVESSLDWAELATTRSSEREQLLRELGAHEVLIDDGALAGRVRELHADGVDAALELVERRPASGDHREGGARRVRRQAGASVPLRGDRRAHRLLDSGTAGGKLVVQVT
jgi:NADPH:quinone reductase-like Zn-dependent oxidoreductase